MMHDLGRTTRARAAELDEAVGSTFVVAVIVVGVLMISLAHAVPVGTVDTAGIAAHEITDLVLVDQALQGIVHGVLLYKLSRLVRRIKRGTGHWRRVHDLNGGPPHQRGLACA